MKKTWWKEAVVYQIYPRSFKDSNGDGIGDLRGVIEKLDYLKELGITVIWLCPCYPSPNADNGYDISDYRDIMPEFGTMADFDELLAKAHERGIRIVMDLVVNHSSDEHKWFQESRKSKDNPYRDYYIWRPGKDGHAPNNWGSYFTPSAWEYDDATKEYYLHLFAKKQPDLNWENPKVREEVYSLMRFWLDKGIDGFRMDVINHIKKPAGLPDSPNPATCAEGYTFDPALYANSPGLVDFLSEMKQKVLNRYDLMTVGETVEVTPEIALRYVNETDGALNMVFHFQITGMRDHFSWKAYKEIQRNWIRELSEKGGWNSQYLQNHDQPRCVSVYGNDGAYRLESAKLLGTILHTLPGTPYVYQGEEIGMTNTPFTDIAQFNDINAHFDYDQMLKAGKSPAEALDNLNHYSRDHARTPMQWSDEAQAGFTTGKPWLMINPNYTQINVQAAMQDPNSVYHYYKKLIALRKEHSAMVYGNFEEYLPDSDKVYVYTRSDENETLLVMLNLTDAEQKLAVPVAGAKRVLLSNYEPQAAYEGEVTLRPYEAVILQMEK